ncbi:MAG TPA: hypothetical protein VIP09_06575 [Dehalococcoidia bacterium]
MHWDASSLATTYAPEFRDYLSEYGFSGTACSAAEGSTVRIIPIAGSGPNSLSAFAIENGAGLIYVLPANIQVGAESDLAISLVNAMQSLRRALLRPKTAPIADSFTFQAEEPLRQDRDEKVARIAELDARLAGYQARKDILFLRDDRLADRLPEWLVENLALRGEREERYREDFWLLDEKGARSVICEAKGVNDNVKREHITKLRLHREEHDLPDEYPSLLIVNTFAGAATVQAKDQQRVGPNECRKAVHDHVLILRTLDLARLADLVEKGVVSLPDIRNYFMTETGWMKVTRDGSEVVKK